MPMTRKQRTRRKLRAKGVRTIPPVSRRDRHRAAPVPAPSRRRSRRERDDDFGSYGYRGGI